MTSLKQFIAKTVQGAAGQPVAVGFLLIGFFLFIFILSEQVGEARPPLFYGDDKVAHFILFSPAGFMLGLLLSQTLPVGVGWCYTAALLVFWGVFDECHQGLVPGRSPDIYDALADTLGGFFGYKFAVMLLVWRRD